MKLYFPATIAFTLCAMISVGQVKFEQGYIIFPENNKVECLIRNGNWLRTPDEITYKIGEAGALTKASANEISEFAVGDNRFVSAEVNIDYTPRDPAKVDYNKHPVWVKEKLFLRVVAEGKASLYFVSRKDVDRFFFKSDKNDSIRQLIYKPYRVTGATVKYNNTFQGQLTYEVACEGQTASPGRLEYKMSSLRNYFDNYNTCRGDVVERGKSKAPSEFHLYITPGVDISRVLVENGSNITEYGQQKSLRYAFEAEFVLPFNSRKWAIFIEPTYQTYESSEPFVATIKSFEMPAGARHYFYLSDDAKIFLNAAAVLDFPGKSSIQYHRSINPTEVSKTTTFSFATGGGFKYSRFGLEARYYFPRSRLDKNGGQFVVQEKLSVILSVRVF